jgi:Helix-turn-helix domain
MPRAIPVAVRQVIWQRHQQGESTTALAAASGVSPRAVRALLRRLRSGGPDAIRPRYHAPPPPPHAKPVVCRAEVVRLRREHPTWGAAWLLTVLRQRFPDRPWPVPRTAQRWLQAAGLNPAPRGRRPGVNAHRATAPREVWQMDGAECIRLADGAQVCWLRVVDEFTGAALQTTIFPPAAAVSGRHAPGPGRLAPRLHALGPAGAFSRGQRGAVGVG